MGVTATGGPPVLDEVDLLIVHLLQINPRISWADAAGIAGVSATTLATRWERLTAAGLVWLSVYPDLGRTDVLAAFVDINCDAPRRRGVVAALIDDPRVVSIDECAGARDLLLTVMVADLDSLSRLLLDEISVIAGVREIRTGLLTELHSEASRWRLDSLSPAQQRAAEATRRRPERTGTRARLDLAAEWPLIRAVSHNARTSVAELARRTGTSPGAVGRRLDRLLDAGVLTIRCDSSPAATGWPMEWSWLAHVPPGAKRAVVAELCSRPELRLCASVAGGHDLVFTVMARTVAGLGRFEREAAGALDALSPVGTMVHLRRHKRMGWVIGEDGRATGRVVVPDVFVRRVPA